MKNQEPDKKYSGDPKEVLFELASQFLILGKRGFEDREKFEPQPFASLVNIAFSTELFLKYIHEGYGKKRTGHKLKEDLFDKLKEEDKQEIYRSIIFNSIINGKPEKYQHNKLTEFMETHSEIFYNFRYLHQNFKEAFKSDIIDFGFLLDFNFAAKTICDTLRNKNSG